MIDREAQRTRVVREERDRGIAEIAGEDDFGATQRVVRDQHRVGDDEDVLSVLVPHRVDGDSCGRCDQGCDADISERFEASRIGRGNDDGVLAIAHQVLHDRDEATGVSVGEDNDDAPGIRVRGELFGARSCHGATRTNGSRMGAKVAQTRTGADDERRTFHGPVAIFGSAIERVESGGTVPTGGASNE